MKTSHIIGLVVLALAVVIIMSTGKNASQYVTFTEARKIASDGSENQIHVVGTLKKGGQGEIIGINKSPDQLSFRFTMVDNDGREQEVYHPNPMPTDFTKSEQVVVVGRYYNDEFIAKKILLKCPSKYQEEEIEV